MIGFVPATGLAYYNGFQFPGPIHVKVSGTPERDSTGRYTKATRYRFVIESIIAPEMEVGTTSPGGIAVQSFFPADKTIEGYDTGTPLVINPSQMTDLTTVGMHKLRTALLQQGKRFIFLGKGLGRDWNIDTIRSDTDYGPKPLNFHWEPFGDDRVARIVWEVEVSISDCIPNRAIQGNISEFSYEAEYVIDASGLTTRVITGEIQIVNKLNSTTGIPQSNLDSIRSRFNFPCPDGFQRVANSWLLNTRRDMIKFKIADTEHPSDNPLYPGLVSIDARQRVENSGIIKANVWNISLSANIQVAAGVPRWYAWLAFQQIVKSRLDIARQRAKVFVPSTSSSSSAGGTKRGTIPILRNLFIEEEIYGRGMSFGIQYTLYNTLGTILEASGLWEPISKSNSWAAYGESMKKVYSPRGVAGLYHNQQDDAIITLCNPRVSVSGSSQNTNRSSRFPPRIFLDDWETPKADESWVKFKHHLVFEQDTNATAHTPLGGQDRTVTTTDTNLVGYASQGAKSPIVQSRSSSTWYAQFSGWALRLGHEIPIPRLEKAGGAEVVGPVGKSYFETWIVGTQGSVKLHAAVWGNRYILAGPPTGSTYTLNPDMRTNDNE